MAVGPLAGYRLVAAAMKAGYRLAGTPEGEGFFTWLLRRVTEVATGAAATREGASDPCLELEAAGLPLYALTPRGDNARVPAAQRLRPRR
jgi:hypothetical protein